MNINRRWIFYNLHFIAILFLFFSCKKTIDYRGLLKWLDDPENGLVVIKKSNTFELKLKYLPKEYFIAREFSLSDDSLHNNIIADSISNGYQGNLYFLLHIDNDPSILAKESDIMFRDINNYSDYVDRIYKFNFNIAEDIELQKGNQIYHPVLTTFENHYGLEGGRNLLLVFSPKNNKDEFSEVTDLEIIFKDEELGIGTTHFFIKANDILNVPEMAFIN